jgi:caa(3)-type oxidase subunit IV
MAHAAHSHSHDHGAHGHAGHGGGHGHGPHHPASYYVKIWALLLGLLVISILGPMLGHKVLTLITAFGIAIVKALIVAAFFMHLNIEKRYVWYLLFAMLLMVGLFFGATAPDINHVRGRNWINRSAEHHIENHPMFAPHEDFHEGGAPEGAAPAAGAEGGEHGAEGTPAEGAKEP